MNDVLGMKIRFIPIYFTNYTNQDVYVKTELLTYFQSFCFLYNLTNQYNTNINLMTSQDIENVNIHSENAEIKNETDSNTCTKSTQTERNSHLQDFDVECDMCFYKIKFNSAQRKRLRKSEFMKVI